MKQIPIKLGKDTIVEAIFEIRFRSNMDSVADVLPGLLFQRLRESFPKTLRLPAADIPTSIRQSDPNLFYIPYYKLLGDDYNLSIGERVFSINCPRPYIRWNDGFKDFILNTMKLVQSTGVVDNIERFSIKYVNLIPTTAESLGLNVMEVSLKAGIYDLSKNNTHVRTEILEDGLVNVVQISSGASAVFDDIGEVSGALLDIDVIKMGPFDNFWNDLSELLEHAHANEKKIFTELLTAETIQNLDPQYHE